jgi:hypothetical protein
VVLPYWTDQHGNLSLDVDRASRRLGLDRLDTGTVTVSVGRLRAPLPLHVPGATVAVLRLTSTHRSLDVPATLSPATDGALLEADLPVGELSGVLWRTALCATPEAADPRFLPLPLALHADAHTVRAVRTPRASPLRRLVRRAKRALAAILGRGAKRTPERVSG